jgi:hypothetical protein
MKVDAHDSREKDLSHCCSFSPRPVIEGDQSTKSRVIWVAPSSTKDKNTTAPQEMKGWKLCNYFRYHRIMCTVEYDK